MMLRSAASASVVASIPTVLPFTKPAAASRCRIQVKTASCVLRSIKRRVREIVEWSGDGSRNTAREIGEGKRIGVHEFVAARFERWTSRGAPDQQLDPSAESGDDR